MIFGHPPSLPSDTLIHYHVGQHMKYNTSLSNSCKNLKIMKLLAIYTNTVFIFFINISHSVLQSFRIVCPV
jgi:hypothetical protein